MCLHRDATGQEREDSIPICEREEQGNSTPTEGKEPSNRPSWGSATHMAWDARPAAAAGALTLTDTAASRGRDGAERVVL